MPHTYQLKLESNISESARVLDFVDQINDDIGLDDDLKSRMEMVLSEAVTNSIIHGNKEDLDKSVIVTTVISDESIVIKVTDEGEGFDYTVKPDPTDAENLLKIGGRGLFIIEKMADDVIYKNEGRTVIITFKL